MGAEAVENSLRIPTYGTRLNDACNDLVRTILNANPATQKKEALALKERLEDNRWQLTLEDDYQSNLFFDTLLCLCDNTLHADVGQLKGFYANAWRNILNRIEDAGWQITEKPFSVAG